MMTLLVWFKKVFPPGSRARKVAGVLLIILGFIALVTPFSPGAWLIFIGLEFFGVRLALWDRLKSWWGKKYNDRRD
ncbi:TPA: hypothetical protein DIC39_01760 [Patescibacteria group bacterium]|nr:hypothetical protein [Patescibacteria group bacterium]HCU47767.1 hypothetical protein [Patescibacteria group bacterium]